TAPPGRINRTVDPGDPNGKTPARLTDTTSVGWEAGAVLKTRLAGGDAMQVPSFNTPKNTAARMGRWSANHRKIAIFGWFAFVVASIVIGVGVGQKTIDQNDSNVGQAHRADQILKQA